jgi:probable O-glycosylation ligase (exosortase A-associated)
MRDFIVLAIILGAAPFCFIRPYFGVLMWTLVAYLNPHRLTWGVAYNFPVALVIGGATLAGLPFARNVNRRIFNLQTVLLIVMFGWFCITFLHASQDQILVEHLDDSRAELERIAKILLMTFVTILLVSSKERLRNLFLVTTFSFGFFAVKGSLFVWRTSGEFRVYGPPDSFISDNNAFGLALNMALPMFYYLAKNESNRWIKRFLYLSFFCGIVAVLLTYSRGALLGLLVVLGAIALKSRAKIIATFLMVACAFTVLTFAPSQWMQRMGDFAHGNIDNSAEQRLNSWQFAWELAKEYPITGGGLRTFTPALFEHYTPQFVFNGPHSIYFQTLGEHGFVGLALFLLLLGTTLYSVRAVRKRAAQFAPAAWITPYSHMVEVSLLAFMISGAFLELAYFDLFYQLIATVALLKILLRREIVLHVQEQAKIAAQPVVSGLVEEGAGF